MQLVRWNPNRELFNWHDRVNRLFDGAFSPAVFGNEEASMWGWNPVVDIFENDDHIVIKAELPGIDKKDIQVDVKDRVLTLKGERSTENEVEEDHYYRRERSYGKFERSFTLPAYVDSEKIKADYKDGVLQLEIPKPEERKPKNITVH